MKTHVFYKNFRGCAETGVRHYIKADEGYKQEYKTEGGEIITVYFSNSGENWNASEESTGCFLARGKTLLECKENIEKFMPVIRNMLLEHSLDSVRENYHAMIKERVCNSFLFCIESILYAIKQGQEKFFSFSENEMESICAIHQSQRIKNEDFSICKKCAKYVLCVCENLYPGYGDCEIIKDIKYAANANCGVIA